MKRAQYTARAAGVAIGLATVVAYGSEETRTCQEWLTPEQASSEWNVCNVDTDTLDPLTTEQLTREEFAQREEDVERAVEDAFSDGWDENASDLEPGMKSCEDWAIEFNDEPDDICWMTDIWPDTPLYEDEYLVFAEYYEHERYCSEVLNQDGTYDTPKEKDCEEFYYSEAPTLEDMR
ncbi:hypothetical protein [Glycomyces buryatensis]|uniref:Uncharacterized protein n=1 Tax=Glycomyces buryatensis TaxID=2570927 RepID=A0A4S8QGN6_9ACTN|nr:hypothetical protein [Glycomyces buryatensis]THV42135.1 hypothetical protein FAB82_07805 [Glycomyces buryatensis]